MNRRPSFCEGKRNVTGATQFHDLPFEYRKSLDLFLGSFNLRYGRLVGEGPLGVTVVVRNQQEFALKIVDLPRLKMDLREYFGKYETRLLGLHNSISGLVPVKLIKIMDDRYLYLLMDYHNLSLKTYILNNCGTIPEVTIKKIISQLTQVLLLFHNANLIHNDVKPENIFLTDDMTLLLSDFCYTVFKPDIQPVFQMAYQNILSLTDAFRSKYREKYENEYIISRKCDIYSIGKLIIEMASGSIEPPFSTNEFDENTISTYFNLLDIKYSQELINFVKYCLDFNYNRRFTTGQLLNTPFLTKNEKIYVTPVYF